MILLDKDGKEVSDLRLGIVAAGTSKEFQYFIMNNSPAELVNIEMHLKHKEIKVKKMPDTIPAEMRAEMIIEWSPSLTLKQGLKVDFNISGEEIYE